MKKLPRVASLAIIGAMLLGTFGSVSAWNTYNFATRTTDCPGMLTEPMIATDGDVVTISKWNTSVCYTYAIWEALADWWRKETPLVWGDEPSTIGGVQGSVMSRVGIGSVNGTPSIGFYNGNYGYYGAFGKTSGQKAIGDIILYPKFIGLDDSLNLNGFQGGIRIAPGIDANTVNGNYLIGWEKVNLSDTQPFDNKCQYRVLAGGSMYYVSVVGDTYDNVNNITNALQVTYAGGVVGIWQYDKTGLWHRNRIDMDTTNDPWVRNSGNADWSIEKSCLPSYNPGNY